MKFNRYRVYYENGFWGDEIAVDREEAQMKGNSLAIDNGTRVLRIVKLNAS